MTATNDIPIKNSDRLLKAPASTYADQVAQVAVGPFVTKLIFGMAAGAGEPPEPIHSIILPTPAARELATQILRILDSKDAKQQFGAEVQALLDSLKEQA